MATPLSYCTVTIRPPTPFPYQLAAIDVDDTLVGPEKTISGENRAAVNRLRSLGCRVVLASGRRHDRMMEFCAALGLDDFAISCQGARVRHVRSGKTLHSALVGPGETSALLAEGLARGLTVVIWLADGIYSPALTPRAVSYYSQTGQDPVSFRARSDLDGQPSEKVVWVGEPAALTEADAAVRERYSGRVALTRANGWCLEFSALEASKAAGLAAIARDGNIPREAVLALGDGYNDVSMLSWAGLGIAMAHGHESARSAARQVSPPGDAGTALARALARIFVNSPTKSGA